MHFIDVRFQGRRTNAKSDDNCSVDEEKSTAVEQRVVNMSCAITSTAIAPRPAGVSTGPFSVSDRMCRLQTLASPHVTTGVVLPSVVVVLVSRGDHAAVPTWGNAAVRGRHEARRMMVAEGETDHAKRRDCTQRAMAAPGILSAFVTSPSPDWNDRVINDMNSRDTRSCAVRSTFFPNQKGKMSGTSKTLVSMATIENGTPTRTKSTNLYLPGETTNILTGEETGVMNAVDAASATVIANG
jgi:hypothetical protein